jgi:Domain of unknown function (DUF4345)
MTRSIEDNRVQLTLRILSIFLVVMFFALGIAAYLNPLPLLAGDAFGWSPDGIVGLSAGRAVLGGHFLGLALVAAYAFAKSQYKLLYVLSIGEATIATGRLISLAFDGYDQRVIPPFAIEVFVAAVMFCAARFLQPRPTARFD